MFHIWSISKKCCDLDSKIDLELYFLRSESYFWKGDLLLVKAFLFCWVGPYCWLVIHCTSYYHKLFLGPTFVIFFLCYYGNTEWMKSIIYINIILHPHNKYFWLITCNIMYDGPFYVVKLFLLLSTFICVLYASLGQTLISCLLLSYEKTSQKKRRKFNKSSK
jgi:hypothetical protein